MDSWEKFHYFEQGSWRVDHGSMTLQESAWKKGVSWVLHLPNEESVPLQSDHAQNG